MRPQTESVLNLRPDAAASGRISFFAISEKFQDFPRDLCYNQAHPQRERRPHMSRKKRKRGRGRVLILVVLLALIVFGVFARGIFTTHQHPGRQGTAVGLLRWPPHRRLPAGKSRHPRRPTDPFAPPSAPDHIGGFGGGRGGFSSRHHLADQSAAIARTGSRARECLI